MFFNPNLSSDHLFEFLDGSELHQLHLPRTAGAFMYDEVVKNVTDDVSTVLSGQLLPMLSLRLALSPTQYKLPVCIFSHLHWPITTTIDPHALDTGTFTALPLSTLFILFWLP